jgi:hypothetical protein
MAIGSSYTFSTPFRTISVLVLAGTFALSTGCDNGPEVAPVHGHVSYMGAPVRTGTVTFYPTQGGRPAVGSIKADGSYTLSRKVPGDGVAVGEYNVTLEAREAVTPVASQARSLAEEVSAEPVGKTTVPPKELVPAKYSMVETSGLTATVNSGTNQIDFKLP